MCLCGPRDGHLPSKQTYVGSNPTRGTKKEVTMKLIFLDIDGVVNSDAWFELGTAQQNLNKMTEAKNAYQQALKFDSKNTDALFRLGSIAISNNDKAGMNEIKIAIALVDKDMAEEFDRMMECGTQC